MQRRAQWQNLKYFRQGRRQGYEAVISEHYKSIYRFLAYLTEDVCLAEDLTQDTFIAAWENKHSYKSRASISTWLHKIAYHKFIDSKRRFERNVIFLDRLKEEKNYVQQSSNPLQKLIADEHLHNLYMAMRQLEMSEYTIIVLHYIQGINFRRMAKILDEPVGTVKWRTNKALKRLRKLLRGEL